MSAIADTRPISILPPIAGIRVEDTSKIGFDDPVPVRRLQAAVDRAQGDRLPSRFRARICAEGVRGVGEQAGPLPLLRGSEADFFGPVSALDPLQTLGSTTLKSYGMRSSVMLPSLFAMVS